MHRHQQCRQPRTPRRPSFACWPCREVNAAQSYNTALFRATQDLALPAMTIEIYDLAPCRSTTTICGTRLSVVRRASARENSRRRCAPHRLARIQSFGPALLKNAIDWASRRPDQPFKDKPIAIMGVSNGALGAAFANYHLRQIFVYLDARVLNGPEVMIGNAKVKFDMANCLIDAPTRTFVADHLRKLARLVDRGTKDAGVRAMKQAPKRRRTVAKLLVAARRKV